MTDDNKDNSSGFYGLGIAPKLLEALDKLKFKTPTPIQNQAIPIALQGKDMVGIAQTGTGKTIAFAVPMLQRLAAAEGNGLVLVPTRELAIQVNAVFKQFSHVFGMQTSVIIGGEAISRQLQDLRGRPRIIIATPGRLIDHLQQRTLRLNDVRVLVLDEADRMFDMGFAPQINRILQQVPKERQTMLFSATIPDEVMALAAAYMKLPIRVEVAKSGTAAEKVEQELFMVSKPDKPALLSKLLEKYGGSVLLFMRTKHTARRIVRDIREKGHTAAEIHSNRSLNQRKEALDGFKSGKYRVLVATDIAARGIDVTGIELVINYDLPDANENYVHRIGRTGRAGRAGHAISFASPEQRNDVKAIERIIRTTLPVSTHPDIPSTGFGGHPPEPAAKPVSRPKPHPAGPRQKAAQPPRKPAAPREHDNFGRKPQQLRRAEGAYQKQYVQGRGQERPSGRREGQSGNFRPGGPARGHESGGGGPEQGGRRFKPHTPGQSARFKSPGPARRPDFGQGRRPSGPKRHSSSIVSPSAYFDEPRRAFHPQHNQRQGYPRQPQKPAEPPKKQSGPAGWFSRFIKKKKNDSPD
ncbi:MAG: DEAD/DEAH box helicase [Elusimicrobia bacterium]|nr:DEAD/DEAH box helicase [Elusimicrobiota bacterium]